MRPIILLLVPLVSVLAVARTPERAAAPDPAATEDGIRIYFSPDGGAAGAVIHEIEGATSTLDIAAYAYTHTGIAKATADAHRRGVKVRVLLDKSQSGGKYSSATYLFNAGVPVWTDTAKGLQHNKYLVVDGKTVVTGSFNFTKGGDETNSENLLVIEGKPLLVEAYAGNFDKLMGKAEPYRGVKG